MRDSMKILRLCHSGIAGVFFPIGKIDKGGTCQYSTTECLRECYAMKKEYDETVNIPEREKHKFLDFFIGNPIISVCNEIIKEMDACIDPQSFLSKDLEFHLQIARASGNPILFKLLEMIRYTFWNELMDVMDIPGLREKAIEYHNLIYGAIQAGNKEKAVRFMLEHLTEPERLILARGEKRPQIGLSQIL